MKELIATVSKRGQVTIPAEVQRLLHLEPGDKVRFLIEDERVELATVEFTVASAFGSVRPLPGVTVSDDFEREIAEAKEERAERLIRDLERG